MEFPLSAATGGTGSGAAAPVPADRLRAQGDDQLRLVLETVPAPALVYRASDRTVRYANRLVAPAFGLEPGGMMGRDIRCFFPDEREREERQAQLRETGRVSTLPARARRADGSTLWMAASLERVEFEGAAAVLAVLQDVTALREAEEKAWQEARERDALAEVGRIISSSLATDEVYEQFAVQLRVLIPADQIALNTVDMERGVFEEKYLWGKNVGQRWGQAIPLDGSLTQHVARMGRSFLVPDTAARPELTDEFPQLMPTIRGGLKSIIAVPLNSRGSVVGVLHVRSETAGAYTPRHLSLAESIGAQIAGAIANAQLHERTVQLAEERTLRARLDAENRQLQRLNRAKSQFLSTVSHELRTPLTSVIGFLNVMSRDKHGSLTDDQRRYLAIMRRNAHRLSLRINDLLDVTDIEAGTFELELSEFDARELVEETVQSFLPLFEAGGQTVHNARSDGPLRIRADQARLGQVLANLLSNASRYSPAGSEVHVRAEADGDCLRVTVTDQGVGMTGEEKRQLFTLFFRADHALAGSVPGMGLGLTIASHIVRQHNGEMQVESEVGKGSTFTVRVPTLLS